MFSVFNLAYALAEMPSSWLGDRWGQRRTMARIVSGWSVFTILTGFTQGYWSLLTARFFFGVAEAGAFPTLSRSIARWFPAGERAWANGIMWAGSRLGGSLSPMLAVLLMGRIGWRAMFVAFGLVGIAWSVWWLSWYRDGPENEPSVAPGERPPWRQLLGNPNLLGLFLSYFASGFGFQFYVTWLPTFLIQEHGVSLATAGIYTSIPLATGAVGCAAGGAAADWLSRRLGSVARGRRAVATFGFLLGAAGFVMARQAVSPEAAVAWLSLATAAHDLTLSSVWASCTDLGGRFGGTAAGFVNLASSLSGVMAPVAAAWLAGAFGSFSYVLLVAAGFYLAAAALWQFLRVN